MLRDILMVGSFSQASSESRTTFHLCICIESRNPNQQSMLYHHQYQARSRISTTRNTTTIYHAPIPSVPALSSQSHYRPCFRPTLQQSLSITPLPLFFSLFSLPEHHSNRLARATEAIPTACGKQPEVPNYPILLLLNLRLDPALPLGNIFLFSI